jgi:hypothetical protein
MFGYDNLKSNIENNIINISDYFPDQYNYLNNYKKSLKDGINNTKLKINLSFDILNEPLNVIISNCIGYLYFDDSILLKPLTYYKQHFYIKQYNSCSKLLINYAYKYNKILMPRYQYITCLPNLVNTIIEKYYYL